MLHTMWRLQPWLDARDASSVRAAWKALAPVSREVCHWDRKLTFHGAAQLAGAMLGERADWIVDCDRTGKPVFEVDRVSEDGSFVDHGWNVTERCRETWKLYEHREGRRGVQVLFVGAGSLEGRPEGGGTTFVRVFDGDRAASVGIETRTVATIGEIDLVPLDLYKMSEYFTPPADDLETLRAVVAQVVAELDAHYDTSTLWPVVADPTSIDLRWRPAGTYARTFGDGQRCVAFIVEPGPHGKTSASVHGLPWGHTIDINVGPGQGYLWVQLPGADIDRVRARLGVLTKR